MSEFKEPSFVREVSADTKEKHQLELRELMRKIEYFYIDGLIRSGKNEGRSFSELLMETDPGLKGDLMTLSDLEHGTSDASHDVEYFNEIEDAYKSSGADSPDAAVEAVAEKIKDLYKRWQTLYPDDWQKREANRAGPESEKVGVLSCNIVRYRDRFTLEEPEVGERLRERGLYPDDTYLEVNLPEAYLSEFRITLQSLKDSFAAIASLVVDKHPEANGIIGRSWLLDRPAVRKLTGFEIIGEGRPNWLQFIDESGQINRERLAEMAESGELPFKNLIGVIRTEDFLRRFLPKERRGEIILKEVDPAWRERYGGLRGKVQAEGQRFAQAWDGGKIMDEAGLSAALEAMPSFVSVLEGSDARDAYLSLLRKNFGKKSKEIYQENKDGVDALTGRMEAYYSKIDKDKYRDKKIMIE
jgi:hypothetical protein